MDMKLKQQFSDLWDRYFPGSELPAIFYYSDRDGRAPIVPPPESRHCFILDLQNVRDGRTMAFGGDSIGCAGGKHYLGFSKELRPDFEYFLSCGIPGKLEGERYKQSPELVAEQLKRQSSFDAPGRYIVFKRWDKLEAVDEPMVVVFFAGADVLSGLFTLASFDEADPDAVIAPMGSGCASIVQYPVHESAARTGRSVLGMFDVSARPHVPEGMLTLSVPWPKFVRMVANMEESFLITASWKRVQERISAHNQAL